MQCFNLFLRMAISHRLTVGLGLIYGPTHDLRTGPNGPRILRTMQGFKTELLHWRLAFQSHFIVSKLMKSIQTGSLASCLNHITARTNHESMAS